MAPLNKSCGCKGIRSCLICERQDNAQDNNDKREVVFFNYCPQCNLCIPEKPNEGIADPLYLGKIKLVLNFITEEEEAFVVSSIDKIPWMPSQSGRKKQDFGPKVNFKKKKVKVGDFKGFPTFTKNIIERLHTEKDLMDFSPVELCHLEYVPDRGSSIAPHIDDYWLWGERLVTVNLLSSTILTLSPTTTGGCVEGPEHLGCFYNSLHAAANNNSCGHKLKVNSTQCFTDFCSAQSKLALSNYKIEVKIPLPPRSLFILAGCARLNWSHEIKRCDVDSRRLAMTYRELATDFVLESNDNKNTANRLLELGNNFYDVEVDSK